MQSENVDSGTMIIASRAFDYDGTPSRTLQNHGPTNNANFWNHIDSIVDYMIESRRFIFDIFNAGQNIIVQKLSANEFVPVLIDVKKVGRSMYPTQLQLLHPSGQSNKFRKKLEGFQNRFKNDLEQRQLDHLPHMLRQFDEAV